MDDASPIEAPRERKRAADWTPRNYDLRDAWFTVAHARDVGERPIRRVIHAQPYYLWREDGQIKAAEFRPDLLPQMIKQATAFTGGTGYYPVFERYGYLWAWYGNPDNADQDLAPRIPFLPEKGGLPDEMLATVRFDSTSALSVENLIDLTHADFLHADTIGDGLSESDTVEVEWTSETVTRRRIVKNKTVAPIMRTIGGVTAEFQDFQSTLHVHLRSSVCISYARFRPGYDVPNVQPFLPVGRDRCRADVAFNTSKMPPLLQKGVMTLPLRVTPQDNSVVRPQTPRYYEPSERRDLHSRFDTPGNRYRFQMEQLAERQRQGDFSYASDADTGRDITDILGMDD